MDLYFLGTGAGVPSKQRNVSSIALQLLQERGSTWLFDCGESTQHQILHTNIRPRRIEKIFITHLHGDHIFGLPGLLGSRSFQGGDTPLTVYGPKGIQAYLETSLSVSGTKLAYDLQIIEVEEGTIYEDNQLTVRCFALEHGMPSFGFCVQEHDKPGELLVDRLKEMGVQPGPIYQKIKEQPSVILESGKEIHRKDFVGKPKKGRKVCILGDTRYKEHLKSNVKDADVLVHEATFASEDEKNAYNFFHSTTKQAAQLAKDANVQRLILTHISSRYQNEAVDQLMHEAKEVFSNSEIAYDFFQTQIL
ncbi:ribonuclease Z [Pontibacillus marinus]|uniref:Ribonuclease Z n=1 Tax=Pontibacillus marinus BH030004 = DSM 16465 TaxID=1385511 RepID=A0A0A5G3U4_9BACI|nr:ribonuclease Z [Pontibacillus marinus]KGX85813.1 ribonuclease Z [Pontibacillus marinus BH030004 = DSM 16465]